MTTGKIQLYECRLRRAGVLRVSDVAAGDSVSCAEASARVGAALVRDVPHEQVWCLFLDGRNAFRGAIKLAEGGLHGCALRPMDVFRPVLASGASGFVLVHNHPSGDPTPSAADVKMTRDLHKLAEPLGVHLLDHVVVTGDPKVWKSMREMDLFEDE